MAHQTERKNRNSERIMEAGDTTEREDQRQVAQFRHRREELQGKMEEYINSYYS